MRIFNALILTLALSLSAMAQSPSQSSQDEMLRLLRSLADQANSKQPAAVDPGWPVRVYSVRYVDVRYLLNLLSSFGQNLKAEPNLRAISVRGPVATLDAIGEIIKQYDVPANISKNVDVTVFVLLASSQPQPDTESMPSVLRPVIDQLRNVMTYKSYRVLDTILARGNEGDFIQTSGVISKLAESDPEERPNYHFTARSRVTGAGPDQSIHFDNLNFDLKVLAPANASVPGIGPKAYQEFNIGTAIDVKPGQQVVVGKTTVQDRALILVMSARVVN